VQRWVAGSVFVVLGLLAAGASASSVKSATVGVARPPGA
jgi:hypothetical protein